MARTNLTAQETTIDNAVGVPRWPATIAILAVGGVFFSLSARYTVGPRWGVLALIAALLIPLWMLHRRGLHRLTHAVGLALNGALTFAVASSAALLLYRLGEGTEQALPLLRDAALVWGANVVVFALWYWNLDAGGPSQRHPGKHASQDFSFPQQQQDDDGVVDD
jgi:hypothetical protein